MTKQSSTPNQVHFTMQGKGGVGKSLCSAILAQYLRDRHGEVACYDTDPVNDTFTQYAGLGAKRINILGPDANINARVFDELIEALVARPGIAVVDNGASTFVPLMAYMVENGVVELLRQHGKTVYIHSVLTGGQALLDTWRGLAAMLEAHPAQVVCWLNEYFGDVAKDGKDFSESKLFNTHKERIVGLVRIERRNADTFGKDMEALVSNKLTFAEALQSNSFGLMPRQRLKAIQAALYQQLDAIEF